MCKRAGQTDESKKGKQSTQVNDPKIASQSAITALGGGSVRKFWQKEPERNFRAHTQITLYLHVGQFA